MTKGEIETIQNIVARLKEPNIGCGQRDAVENKNALVVSRIYVDTWLLASLEMLLPGTTRDVDLAVRMSRN